MKPGIKSTELYVVLALLAKPLGLSQWLTPETISSTGQRVVEVASQLQGMGAGNDKFIYLVALVYVAGRQLIKYKTTARG